jgi:hypothetical protein
LLEPLFAKWTFAYGELSDMLIKLVSKFAVVGWSKDVLWNSTNPLMKGIIWGNFYFYKDLVFENNDALWNETLNILNKMNKVPYNKEWKYNEMSLSNLIVELESLEKTIWESTNINRSIRSYLLRQIWFEIDDLKIIKRNNFWKWAKFKYKHLNKEKIIEVEYKSNRLDYLWLMLLKREDPKIFKHRYAFTDLLWWSWPSEIVLDIVALSCMPNISDIPWDIDISVFWSLLALREMFLPK